MCTAPEALTRSSGTWYSSRSARIMVSPLEETAWLLHSLLPATKPIVLTCAMRPATALLADGPQNLRDAVTVAASGGRSGGWGGAGGGGRAAAPGQKGPPYPLQAKRSLGGGPPAVVGEKRVRWVVAP